MLRGGRLQMIWIHYPYLSVYRHGLYIKDIEHNEFNLHKRPADSVQLKLNLNIAARHLLFACTCVSIRPGRVEAASPIDLAKSRTEALQVRRSCATSHPFTFHPVPSQSCVAEDALFGERCQVCHDRGCPCPQLASRSSAPRARRRGKEKVLDQLTFGASWSTAKPDDPFLHEKYRYR